MTTKMADPAARLEQRRALLLDGSMGQQLMRQGIADDPLLWTAHALTGNARQVQTLHEEYIRAGADIITTYTYATNLHRFRNAGGRRRFEQFNRKAGELAMGAVRATGGSALIAASLPPLRKSYAPELVPDFDTMVAEYLPQAEILADYADLFLCETLTTAAEGVAAATAALSVAGSRPVWVSWTLADVSNPQLPGGESLVEAAQRLLELPVAGLLVNCCRPERVAVAIEILAGLPVPFCGAYANGFDASGSQLQKTTGTGLPARDDLDPQAYATFARTWLDAGAKVIGGCCDIGPAHIERLNALL